MRRKEKNKTWVILEIAVIVVSIGCFVVWGNMKTPWRSCSGGYIDLSGLMPGDENGSGAIEGSWIQDYTEYRQGAYGNVTKGSVTISYYQGGQLLYEETFGVGEFVCETVEAKGLPSPYIRISVTEGTEGAVNDKLEIRCKNWQRLMERISGRN